MIKLQFTTITDRIRNKIRNGNCFPKFSIIRKEQKFLPICLRLLTLLTIIKDPSLRGLRGPGSVALSIHVIHYGPRSAFPYYLFNQYTHSRLYCIIVYLFMQVHLDLGHLTLNNGRTLTQFEIYFNKPQNYIQQNLIYNIKCITP